MKFLDGSAGDTDYGRIGAGYSSYRQPEPEILAMIEEALGGAQTIVNVGAGAGSYEPVGRKVTAVEPSESMRAQRFVPMPPAIPGVAESLPFADQAFDAAMATFTIHQWRNLQRGLQEMRRVAKGPVVILTCDPDKVQTFWLNDYAPEVLATEALRYPSRSSIQGALGGTVEIRPIPIPLLCRDGFNEAYYGRPECFLDPGARQANSAWSFVDPNKVISSIHLLKQDLESGTWDERLGSLRQTPHFEGSLCLIVAKP